MSTGLRMKITEDLDTTFDVTAITDGDNNLVAFRDAANEGGTLPSKLIVKVEATHSGVNRNKVEYTPFGLENSTDSWTSNYNKPVLLNHNSYSDPLGRVKSAEYKQSVMDNSKYCIELTLEITNAAAIERFLDGRYKTFSIGGYTDSAKCSICGKDQITDGWCGHNRGRKYDGKEAYWTLGKMEYDEISVVNTPADVHAQAIDIKLVSEEPKAKEGNTSEDNAPTGNVADSLLDNMDSLLGNTDENEPTTEPTAEPTTEPEAHADGVKNDNVITDEQLQELRDKVTELEALVAERDGSISELETKLTTALADATVSNDRTAVLEDEIKALTQQNVDFARLSHSILCDQVAGLQIAIGDKTLEEKDELLAEYKTYTSRKLSDLAASILTPEKVQERARVTSPGVVSDSDEFIGTDNETGTPTEKTLDDYVNAVTGFITKNI